jgi:hypothetical protein
MILYAVVVEDDRDGKGPVRYLMDRTVYTSKTAAKRRATMYPHWYGAVVKEFDVDWCHRPRERIFTTNDPPAFVPDDEAKRLQEDGKQVNETKISYGVPS